MKTQPFSLAHQDWSMGGDEARRAGREDHAEGVLGHEPFQSGARWLVENSARMQTTPLGADRGS
jgi:hypothetical protein